MRIWGTLTALAGLLAVSSAAAQTTQTYFYDGHGRLQATTNAPANGGSRVRYGMDAANNRSSRDSDAIPGRVVPDQLRPWENLLPGQALQSPDGRFVFVLQIDGNAVIYGLPIGWSTNTAGGRSTVMAMQSDGNLVIRGPANELIWNSGTSGHPGAKLVMQNDGNLVIYDGATGVWSSGTCCY